MLGTAFPHFLSSLEHSFNWEYVIFTSSSLATVGGLAIYFTVADGPYRKPATAIKPSAFLSVFNNKPFRGASFGYFGHMWELYAFWTFVPIIMKFNPLHTGADLSVSLWHFTQLELEP